MGTDEKACVIEGVLNDEPSGSTLNPSTQQQQQQQQEEQQQVEEGGANRPSSSSSRASPSRRAARRRPRRNLSVENLTRTLSSSSFGTLVNNYLRRNISKPKMASRAEAAASTRAMRRDISGRSRRSVESVAEDTDDTDVLYI